MKPNADSVGRRIAELAAMCNTFCAEALEDQTSAAILEAAAYATYVARAHFGTDDNILDVDENEAFFRAGAWNVATRIAVVIAGQVGERVGVSGGLIQSALRYAAIQYCRQVDDTPAAATMEG